MKNDIYLSLANNTYTQNIFKALNLPLPRILKRDTDQPLSLASGSILVASTKGGFAVNEILKTLDAGNTDLFTARESTGKILSATPSAFNSVVSERQIEAHNKQTYDALLFDATGVKSVDSLEAIYLFFKHTLKQLKPNSRIIIFTQTSDQCDNPAHGAVQGGIDGFARSLAKELGKKASTCNIIKLEKGAQKHLKSALLFLLSQKSSYITGQSLRLSNQAKKQDKFSWSFPLKGKTALVTGAAQGIGYQTAITLARDGAKVICLDIPQNKTQLEVLATQINGHALALDLTEEGAVKTLTETISSQLGIIDIVVHNAGITRDKTLANMPVHFWKQVLDLNLAKVIEINEALIQRKAFAENARLVCISSISGIAGNFGQTNYALSKSGIVTYTEHMSKLFHQQRQDGITINAIAPGFIESQMTQKIPFLTREIGRRLNTLSQGGLPEDIAEAVSFFCHPASQAMSGNLLRVCGQNILGR